MVLWIRPIRHRHTLYPHQSHSDLVSVLSVIFADSYVVPGSEGDDAAVDATTGVDDDHQ